MLQKHYCNEDAALRPPSTKLILKLARGRVEALPRNLTVGYGSATRSSLIVRPTRAIHVVA